MKPARFPAMQALTELRRTSAAVIEVTDVIIHGTEGDASVAVRALPARVRALLFRAKRCLDMLESEGIS